ncbi:MAG: transketolase [Bacilli bacterium]|jgi:transketolase|nr:transketolase [Bacilli bacterium]MDD3388830.1 transketolase [Bacilli bacterium]MDD4345019.1 transketolase [Bacilli bacterium]MDD4520510.1 transketolase [Bacilli bacterium]MDY0399198.1 transketolase [Bacilli bacterium]
MFGSKKFTETELLAISAIRATVIDGTNLAKSGHPGMAIGSAPALYTLFNRHLVSDPANPTWINRDRFVLSAGHASMLLYTLLHFGGYQVSLDDLKKFRQIDSITPGHPEVGLTPGVDATTGPLGQGLAQAVGLAVAEEALRAQYPEGNKIIDHYTYALIGDGCLQEGISQEAISFAGHQKLHKLIVLYDANSVTLDGPLSNSFSEDIPARFRAANWFVQVINDGNDVKAIDKAIRKAKRSKTQPSLIMYKSVIGQGSVNQGTYKVHGNPLGVIDGAHAKGTYLYHQAEWEIPAEVYQVFKDNFVSRGTSAYKDWLKQTTSYRRQHPDEGEFLFNHLGVDVTDCLKNPLPTFEPNSSASTRVTSGEYLNSLVDEVPHLIGGSADVAHSVMTMLSNHKDFTSENRAGRNINFGIREFAMAAIQNGMLLHGGLRTYVGTFLVFSDYMKNALRLASLSHLPAIYLFSHDSLALGEDGPTHQPIEQLTMLRAIPDMDVLRPADANETVASWKLALSRTDGPTALILSRQNLPLLANSDPFQVEKGGYVLEWEGNEGVMDATLVASGSEVALALEARKILAEKHKVDVRLVSMPSLNRFVNLPSEDQARIIGTSYDKVIAVEMAATMPWYRVAKTVFGVDHFGASAPAKDVLNKFNYTAEHLVEVVLQAIGK